MAEYQIGVGVALIVLRDDKVLMARRKGSHAAGLYSFPGGHLEKYETWEGCAKRELREECGKDIKVRMNTPSRGGLFVHNSILMKDERHYITIFLSASWLSGEPQLMEPEKSEVWEWLPITDVLKMLQQPEYAAWIPFRPFLGLVQQLCPGYASKEST